MTGIEYLTVGHEGKNARHAGEDFHIYDVSYKRQKNHPFKIGQYVCCICLAGEATGLIDLMPCHLHASTIAVNVPAQILEQHAMSKDFQGIGISMSRRFVKKLGLPYNFRLDRMLRQSPLIELQQPQLEAILSYCTMVRRLLEQAHPYQAETLRHLTCAFFYGIGSYLYQLTERQSFSNEEIITQRFLTKVREHYRHQRKVGFYADSMHISLGHLYSVIKHVSGKSPGKWIDEYVAEEAKALLKGSAMTVQQISIELGFPSQSFFGKFFKRMTGLSPKRYRIEPTD